MPATLYSAHDAKGYLLTPDEVVTFQRNGGGALPGKNVITRDYVNDSGTFIEAESDAEKVLEKHGLTKEVGTRRLLW
ncbi:hypothetical protein MUP32_00715 [Candidatus Microgenomates bacterium]|nr:hypothetical protein [Candidatus Microgenomates bacterium]